MKVLAISDTHRDLRGAGLAIRHTMRQGLDIVIHCGDHIGDAKKLESQFPSIKFYYVPGNCDGWFFNEEERIKVFEIEGKKVLITHGDLHNINFSYKKLFLDMKNKNADIGVCGHSHVVHYEEERATGRIALNPGSISLPRDSRFPSYLVLDIKKGQPIQVKHMKIRHGKPIQIQVF